jgi:hypothetical protein
VTRGAYGVKCKAQGVGIVGADPCVCPADHSNPEVELPTPGEHMGSPLQAIWVGYMTMLYGFTRIGYVPPGKEAHQAILIGGCMKGLFGFGAIAVII